MRKPVYEQMGGFDENLVVGYNDVDFCFSLYENGYYNVLCNGARLYHHESLSRGYDKGNIGKEKRLLEERKYLYEKHPHLEKRDPFYNPNLTRYLGEFEWNLDAYGCREEQLPELPCSKVEPFDGISGRSGWIRIWYFRLTGSVERWPGTDRRLGIYP